MGVNRVRRRARAFLSGALLWGPSLALVAIVWAGMAVRLGVSATSAPVETISPQFRLVDSEGHARSLADYRGESLIVVFGFTSCPDACPLELHKLADAMLLLGTDASAVHVVFITVDPERDSPQVLKQYMAAFDPRFTGLTGSPAQIQAAAELFSVVFERVPVGDGYTIDHSTGFYLVDAAGMYRGAVPSDATSRDLAAAIRTLEKYLGKAA